MSSISRTSSESHSLPDITESELKTHLRGRGTKKLDQMDWAIRILSVIALVAFVATIVLIGLSLAEYVHPLLALYTLSASVGVFIIIKMIDCCQQVVAKKHHIDLVDYYRTRQPLPKKPNESLKDS